LITVPHIFKSGALLAERIHQLLLVSPVDVVYSVVLIVGDLVVPVQFDA